MTAPLSLFDEIGGEPAVAAVVEGFYARLTADPAVLHFFDPQRLDALKAGQRQYFTRLLGGPDRYEGPDLRTAHAHIEITDAQVTAVLDHLRASVLDAGVPPAKADRVLALAARVWWARQW